ncbi:MAG: hypothetical protein K2X91_12210, partial [Thermoleophilia bacterium]|nr:hypothetical protein [Thermoleophilia bacterium]
AETGDLLYVVEIPDDAATPRLVLRLAQDRGRSTAAPAALLRRPLTIRSASILDGAVLALTAGLTILFGAL